MSGVGGCKRNVRKGNGHKYRTSVARLRSEGRGCWICRVFGRPDGIDYTLPPHDPGAFEVDHLVPCSEGGSLYDPANLDATHRVCNEWRSNKSVAEVIEAARQTNAPAVTPTTDW